MRAASDLLLLLLVMTSFAVLGSSRLSACIRWIALQGAILGLLPLTNDVTLHTAVLATGTVLVKALLLPASMRWAIREAAIRREMEPLIGYMASMLLGAAALGTAFAVASRLPTPARYGLLVPVALVTVMIGMLVLVTRAKAISQVVGYVMLENGVYVFGLTLAHRVPFLLEVGVLLDVFVGVFIMGIVVFHINREFDTTSSARLVELRDH